ncbi:MAG: class I SAM-dependent methyltransferase [Caulobacteraceae bacterium]
MVNVDAGVRRGKIDAVGALDAFDLLGFAGGEQGWPPGYITNGFGSDAALFRRVIGRWGFADLGRIADVGCGFGRWSVFLAEANDAVVGYDDNEEGVRLGRRLADLFALTNLSFETADIAALPAASGACDGVWCYNALHLTDRGRVLSEANRVLRMGGRLAILEYNGAGRILEKFFAGHARGGVHQKTAKYALNCLKNGGRHNGAENYGDVEAAPAMLEAFGFALAESVVAKIAAPGADKGGLDDLPALAERLLSDRAFRDDFAKRPGIAKTLPTNLDLVATKVRELEG